MPAIAVNGTRLEYHEQGDGEPVVLVHGSLGDHRSWESQVDAFAGRYRVIAYSRRYHHPNQCGGCESDYSAALHADDLAGLMTGLGLESAYVVGNSYGAFTALFLAARHPDRVRAMVLGEPPVLPLLDDDPEGRRVRDEFLATVWQPAAEVLQKGESLEGVRRFVDAVAGDGAFDGFPQEVQDLIMDNACEFRVETSSPDFFTPFTCEEARGVATPALLLTGERSLRVFRLVVDVLGQCLPDCASVVIPESTHELPADDPEAYNEAVLTFLAGRDS